MLYRSVFPCMITYSVKITKIKTQVNTGLLLLSHLSLAPQSVGAMSFNDSFLAQRYFYDPIFWVMNAKHNNFQEKRMCSTTKSKQYSKPVRFDIPLLTTLESIWYLPEYYLRCCLQVKPKTIVEWCWYGAIIRLKVIGDSNKDPLEQRWAITFLGGPHCHNGHCY